MVYSVGHTIVRQTHYKSVPTSLGISWLNGTPGKPVPGTPSSNVHQSLLTP